MNMIRLLTESDRYARCLKASRKVRWEIEADVIRGRTFDEADRYLPDRLTLVDRFTSLSGDEKRFVGRIQGRTYANMIGLAERFITAKVLALSRDHWLGDQVALEALVRFADEALKHQALFRRIEAMVAGTMPAGYRFDPDPNAVAAVVLGKGRWAVLGLMLHIELSTQAHYRESIGPAGGLSPLFRDVLLHHWQEESQHAVLDELEWVRHDATLGEAERDAAVDDFIALLAVVDGILRRQAAADAVYFTATCGRPVDAEELAAIGKGFRAAYRRQFIHAGAHHPQFVETLCSLTTQPQIDRITSALAALQ